MKKNERPITVYGKNISSIELAGNETYGYWIEMWDDKLQRYFRMKAEELLKIIPKYKFTGKKKRVHIWLTL